MIYGLGWVNAIKGMGIFRRRSRFDAQTEHYEVSLWQRLREDFSQSSDVIERLGAWLGDSRGRLALFGVVTILAVLGLLLLSILLFGAPSGVDKEFTPVGLVGVVPVGTVGGVG